MQDGLEVVGRDLVSLLRYQGFGGVQADKDAALNWLSRRALVPQQDRLFITPGAHPALLGILGHSGEARRCRALGSAHLSRRALDRGAARAEARRPADGRRRHRSRCVRRGLRAAAARRRSISIRRCSIRRRTRSRAATDRDRRDRAPLRRADRRGRSLRLPADRRTAAVRGARARSHLACRRARQMPRRRTAHRLCGGAGRALRLAVRLVGAHRDRDGLADDDRARDPLDRRRHRRCVAGGGAPGIRWSGSGWSPRSCRRARFRADPVGFHLWLSLPRILDPLGLRRPHARRPASASSPATPSPPTARRPRRCASASADRPNDPPCAARSNSWRMP